MFKYHLPSDKIFFNIILGAKEWETRYCKHNWADGYFDSYASCYTRSQPAQQSLATDKAAKCITALSDFLLKSCRFSLRLGNSEASKAAVSWRELCILFK